MSGSTVATGIIWAIGGFQVIANATMLIRGRIRLPTELAQASPRVTELLQTSWLYGSLSNLLLAVVLILEASRAAQGAGSAKLVVAVIATNYVAFAVSAYRLHHRVGLLAFAAMGAALYLTLLL